MGFNPAKRRAARSARRDTGGKARPTDPQHRPPFEAVQPDEYVPRRKRPWIAASFKFVGKEKLPYHAIFELTPDGLPIPESQGTAFFIHEKGVFLTAKHVVSNPHVQYGIIAPKPGVDHRGKALPRSMVRVRHIERHETMDVAIGRIEAIGQDLHTWPLSARPMQEGELLLAFGYPMSKVRVINQTGQINLFPRFREGVVVETEALAWRFRHNAWTQPGMSGGPVSRAPGRAVCGITSTGMPAPVEPVEFAVKIASIVDWPIPFLQYRTIRDLCFIDGEPPRDSPPRLESPTVDPA